MEKELSFYIEVYKKYIDCISKTNHTPESVKEDLDIIFGDLYWEELYDISLTAFNSQHHYFRQCLRELLYNIIVA